MEEILDVFNRKGEVVDKASREVVHQNGLWHKAVVTFIINDKLQVLLQRRSKTRVYPNLWDASSSGHVSEGENGAVAVVREAKEELGLTLNKNKLQHILTDKNKYKDKLVKDFQIIEYYIIKQNLNIKDVVIQKEEVSNVKWLSLEKYIEKLKNKDKTFLVHSKNEFKILNTYLQFQKFKKGLH